MSTQQGCCPELQAQRAATNEVQGFVGAGRRGAGAKGQIGEAHTYIDRCVAGTSTQRTPSGTRTARLYICVCRDIFLALLPPPSGIIADLITSSITNQGGTDVKVTRWPGQCGCKTSSDWSDRHALAVYDVEFTVRIAYMNH